MKPGSLFSRKAGLGLLAAVLIVGFGWVVARSGPLSPIRVTSLRVEAGALSPAIFGIGTVEARRGPDEQVVGDRPDAPDVGGVAGSMASGDLG